MCEKEYEQIVRTPVVVGRGVISRRFVCIYRLVSAGASPRPTIFPASKPALWNAPIRVVFVLHLRRNRYGVWNDGDAVIDSIEAICDVGQLYPHGVDMDKSCEIVVIAVKTTVESVVRLCGDKISIVRESRNEQGMILSALLATELDNVANLKSLRRHFPAKRTCALV